jgi:hypothetical protein
MLRKARIWPLNALARSTQTLEGFWWASRKQYRMLKANLIRNQTTTGNLNHTFLLDAYQPMEIWATDANQLIKSIYKRYGRSRVNAMSMLHTPPPQTFLLGNIILRNASILYYSHYSRQSKYWQTLVQN